MKRQNIPYHWTSTAIEMFKISYSPPLVTVSRRCSINCSLRSSHIPMCVGPDNINVVSGSGFRVQLSSLLLQRACGFLTLHKVSAVGHFQLDRLKSPAIRSEQQPSRGGRRPWHGNRHGWFITEGRTVGEIKKKRCDVQIKAVTIQAWTWNQQMSTIMDPSLKSALVWKFPEMALKN